VVIIQIAAAALLLLGSALIFRALLEMDVPTRPSSAVRRPRHPVEHPSDMDLPRAA
jgi:hypothetical protein